MQNINLQNILVPNVSVATGAQGVSNKIAKGQSGDEFAQLFGTINNNVSNIVNNTVNSTANNATNAVNASGIDLEKVIELISNTIRRSPELLDHVAISTPDSLFGGKNMGMDSMPVKELLSQGQTPQIDFVKKVESLLSSNKVLIEKLVANPEVCEKLNIEVIQAPVKAVNGETIIKKLIQFNEDTPFKAVQNFVENNSEIVAGNLKEKIVPLKGLRKLDNSNFDLNLKNDFEEKIVNASKLSNNHKAAANAYATKQSQLEDNIIKFPKAMQKEFINKSDELSKHLKIANNDHNVVNFNVTNQMKAPVIAGTASLAASHTLNLSSIDASSPNELIQKIADYIDQRAITKNGGLDLLVSHKELGQFKVSVAQGIHKDHLDLQILTMSREGHELFKAHENNLIKTLAASGISLGEFSIMTKDIPRVVSDNSNFNHNNGNSHSESSFDFDRKDSEQRDSQRRREMWEEYRERFSA